MINTHIFTTALAAVILSVNLFFPHIYVSPEDSVPETYRMFEEDNESDNVPVSTANPKSLSYWEETYHTINLTGNVSQDVLLIARSQIGYYGDPNYYIVDDIDGIKVRTRYGEWFGWPYSYWCDMFVSFCVYYAGLEEYPFEVSCMRHELKLKQSGYWRDWRTYIPKPGDIIFVKDEAHSTATHVGIVEKALPATEDGPGIIFTIEGNMHNPTPALPNCVKRCTRSFDEVIGYATYEVGEILPNKLTYRDEKNPGLNYERYFNVEPDPTVMTFIGQTDSIYFRSYFPREDVREEESMMVAPKSVKHSLMRSNTNPKPVFETENIAYIEME